MKVAVVLNGDEPGNDELKLLDACDAIVCADGAVQALLKTNHPPTVIVGDLDSITPEAYQWAEALEIPIERHKPEKDETDGELALERALAMDPQSILILGGHGGRSAMFLANLKLLRRAYNKGLDAAMVGHGESVRYLGSGGQIALAGRGGSTLNVLAVDENAVLDLDGTSWDGKEIHLDRISARGVSNKITTDGASVRVRSGTVLVILERPAKAPKE